MTSVALKGADTAVIATQKKVPVSIVLEDSKIRNHVHFIFSFIREISKI